MTVEEKAALDSLTLLQESIEPDPIKARNCTVQGCWGKRGWAGVKVVVNPKTGKGEYVLQVCCGKSRRTEVAIAHEAITELAGQLKSVSEVQVAQGRALLDEFHNIRLNLADHDSNVKAGLEVIWRSFAINKLRLLWDWLAGHLKRALHRLRNRMHPLSAAEVRAATPAIDLPPKKKYKRTTVGDYHGGCPEMPMVPTDPTPNLVEEEGRGA